MIRDKLKFDAGETPPFYMVAPLNFVLPESLLQARPDELDQLGLVLFAQYARDVKHLEISGYSYISFLI